MPVEAKKTEQRSILRVHTKPNHTTQLSPDFLQERDERRIDPLRRMMRWGAEEFLAQIIIIDYGSIPPQAFLPSLTFSAFTTPDSKETYYKFKFKESLPNFLIRPRFSSKIIIIILQWGTIMTIFWGLARVFKNLHKSGLSVEQNPRIFSNSNLIKLDANNN